MRKTTKAQNTNAFDLFTLFSIAKNGKTYDNCRRFCNVQVYQVVSANTECHRKNHELIVSCKSPNFFKR